jgi:hypothetical protein
MGRGVEHVLKDRFRDHTPQWLHDMHVRGNSADS